MKDIGLSNIQRQTFEGVLLTHSSYTIPFFQREYSWSKDGWSDFLEDAAKAGDDGKQHFFGFMTFKKENDAEFLIIEGQQRFTTATILLAVARDIFYEAEDDSWKSLDEYIRFTDPLSPSEPPSYKLILSELNKEFFQKYIQNIDKPRNKISNMEAEPRINLSNRNIFGCYKYYYTELAKRCNGLTAEEKKNYLLDLVRVVLRNFVIIKTEVADEKAAFNIFQTLNDRGLDLTITDIIKVFLFGLVGESWKDARDKWDDIRETLSLQNTNAFFRHYWLSKHRIVKEKELLNEIELKVKTKADVFKFLDDLKDEADYYEALLNPSKDFWGKKSAQIVELLEELHLLSKQQPLPLLMASCKEDKFPTNEFIKLLKICINFIFRYLTIAELENKELERLFSEIAIDIRKGRIRNTKEIKSKLLRENIDDESFVSNFRKKQIKAVRVAKYILKKIESHLSPEGEKVVKRITLEHILPKSPDDEWKEYLKEHDMDKDDFVYRIGNMTLLLEKPNKKAQSTFFINKRDNIYRKETRLEINSDLKNITSWTDQDILNRQEEFAKLASSIWTLHI